MSAAKKCDRCKEFYEPFKSSGPFLVDQNTTNRNLYVDLCPNCTDTLKKWLKGDVQMIIFTGDEEAADEQHDHGDD